MNLIEELITLYHYLDVRRIAQLCALVLITLLATMAEVISLGAVMPLLTVLMSGDINSIPVFGELNFLASVGFRHAVYYCAAMLAIASCIAGVLRLSLVWAQNKTCYAIGGDIIYSVFNRVLGQSYPEFIKENSADSVNVIMNKCNRVVTEVLVPLVSLTSAAIMGAIISTLLFIVDPITAFVAGSLFCTIYITIVISTRRFVKSDGSRISDTQTRIQRVVYESLRGFRDILINGSKERVLAKFNGLVKSYNRASANVQILGASPRFVIEAFAIMCISLLLSLKVNDKSQAADIVPILALYAIAAQRLLPIIQQAYSSYVSISGASAILGEVNSYLQKNLKSNSSYPAPNTPIISVDQISLVDVSFSYGPTSKNSLNKVGFEVNRGDIVGIVGESGSGKSTLMDILMGLQSPTSGSVMVNGTRLDYGNICEWYKCIAHVPQKIFMTDSTLSLIISDSVNDGEVDDKKLLDAAQYSLVFDFINDLSSLHTTYCGEDGVLLSGGQRQRVAIGKALYKNSQVLFLDESTNGLDKLTETRLLESLKEWGKNRIIFIVSHRSETLKHCNKILEVNNGRVVLK